MTDQPDDLSQEIHLRAAVEDARTQYEQAHVNWQAASTRYEAILKEFSAYVFGRTTVLKSSANGGISVAWLNWNTDEKTNLHLDSIHSSGLDGSS